MAVEILSAAEQNIVEIWEYTNREWGTVQADNYVRGLVKAIKDSSRRRKLWKKFSDKTVRGVFYLRYRHHLIFFREFSDGVIGVITVLHESMDLSARLKEDIQRSDQN